MIREASVAYAAPGRSHARAKINTGSSTPFTILATRVVYMACFASQRALRIELSHMASAINGIQRDTILRYVTASSRVSHSAHKRARRGEANI